MGFHGNSDDFRSETQPFFQSDPRRRRESSGLGRRSAVQPLFGRRCGWNQTEAPSFQGTRWSCSGCSRDLVKVLVEAGMSPRKHGGDDVCWWLMNDQFEIDFNYSWAM